MTDWKARDLLRDKATKQVTLPYDVFREQWESLATKESHELTPRAWQMGRALWALGARPAVAYDRMRDLLDCFNGHFCVDADDWKARAEELQSILVECVNAIPGCVAAPDVSAEFLAGVPGEVRALALRLPALHEANANHAREAIQAEQRAESAERKLAAVKSAFSDLDALASILLQDHKLACDELEHSEGEEEAELSRSVNRDVRKALDDLRSALETSARPAETDVAASPAAPEPDHGVSPPESACECCGFATDVYPVPQQLGTDPDGFTAWISQSCQERLGLSAVTAIIRGKRAESELARVRGELSYQTDCVIGAEDMCNQLRAELEKTRTVVDLTKRYVEATHDPTHDAWVMLSDAIDALENTGGES
jgi:hypothetical protein